jgi:hypothetical protein
VSRSKAAKTQSFALRQPVECEESAAQIPVPSRKSQLAAGIEKSHDSGRNQMGDLTVCQLVTTSGDL